MPIGKDRYVREKQAVRKVENGGKPAVTMYEVQETFEMPAAATLETGSLRGRSNKPKPPEQFSLVKLTPKTGRTHQLRVHLATIGYPDRRRHDVRRAGLQCTGISSSSGRRCTRLRSLLCILGRWK